MKRLLNILIFTTIGLSLLAAFLPQLQDWLTLSRAGIEQLYLWQLFTYPLVEPGPLSFRFFLQLAFNMYILWMFGSPLIERSRPGPFFLLYFGGGLAAGLTALAFPHAALAGSTNAVFAILVAWMMLNPGAQLLLFFALPFKAHWLIVALLGITFFLDISNGDWMRCASLAASVAFSYIFSIAVWREQSPFPFLRSFERKILKLLERKKKEPYHHSKIYDIKSGSPILDDEQFMDAMLDRISRYGKDSLTAEEKRRMKTISEKKK